MFFRFFSLFSFLPFILFLIFLYKWLLLSTKNQLKPPTPPKLPIIGNLHQLGKLPHRSLKSLSDKYGELMLLYLGNKPTLVVSSPHAAQEIMKTHDLIFVNRPKLRFINKIFYNGNDVAFGNGEKWSHMKRICVTHLLSNKRVQSFRPIREEEVSFVIEKIKKSYGTVFNLSETLLTFFKDLICRTTLGMRRNESGDAETQTDFYKLFKLLMEVMGELSVGDSIPLLGWVDRLTGLEGRAEFVRKEFDKFIEGIVEEHQIRLNMMNKEYNGDLQDFVDVLLQIHNDNPEELSRENIKALVLDMFVAAVETSSTTIEWAMTELIRHPTIMKKLQKEVREVVKTNTKVTEDDLEKMKYTSAVIKETLRLHPPVPLLLTRESTKDVKIHDKYDIVATTQVVINAWAINRDPRFWQDTEKFNPQRFINNSLSVDFRGNHFQFIPFGAGRRGCPGISSAVAITELLLASLVYEFDWKLPNGKEGESLDVEERAGISVGRENPLMVIATPYERLIN